MALWAFSKTLYMREVSEPWYGDKIKAYFWPEKDIEIAYRDIKQELLSYFIPDVREYVVVKATKPVVAALLPMCSKCDKPVALCLCQCDRAEMIVNTAYLGYEAKRINGKR